MLTKFFAMFMFMFFSHFSFSQDDLTLDEAEEKIEEPSEIKDQPANDVKEDKSAEQPAPMATLSHEEKPVAGSKSEMKNKKSKSNKMKKVKSKDKNKKKKKLKHKKSYKKAKDKKKK